MDLKDYQYIKKKLLWWAKEHCFSSSIMKEEKALNIPVPEKYGDWIIHPCIRYIDKGINGHKWWLVVSPYPNFDSRYENILLYYGNNNDDNCPPTDWTFVKEVCGSHKKGYNSDPNLYYDGNELWVIWREYQTENVPEDISPVCCIMRSKTSDGVLFSEPKIIAYNQYLCNEGIEADTTMCPIVYERNGELCMFGSRYRYTKPMASEGLTRYKYNKNLDFFIEMEKQETSPYCFDLWHFDLFDVEGNDYVILTPQSGNTVYIGRFEQDAIKFYNKPLYSYRWFVRRNYFYKPTAITAGNNVYLLFPRKKGEESIKIVMRSVTKERFFKIFH